MSELRDTLDDLDRQIEALRDEQAAAICAAPRTFEHVSEAISWRTDRYAVVRADGANIGFTSYKQRPAADRHLTALCRRYAGNVYLYDRREGVVVDKYGTVVHRVEAVTS